MAFSTTPTPIPVPQAPTPPQGSPPAPPYELVGQQIQAPLQAANEIQGAVNNYLDNYYKRQQLKASAFEAGGPYLLNQLYGNGKQPQQAAFAPNPNASDSPQTPNTSGQDAMASAPGSNSQPLMHPTSGLPQTIHDAVSAGMPDYAGMLDQAGQYTQMGKYGREQIQNLGNMAALAKSPMDYELSKLGLQKTQNDIAMQPTEADLKKQLLANAEQQIPMEKNKTIAGEASKLSQQKTEVKTLQGMFDNLDKNLHSYYSDPKSFVGSGNLQKITKGRMGSASGGNVINQGKPLVAAVNQLLTHRFNMAEGQLLGDSIVPSPNDTPQYAASKMKMMHQIIQAMDTGNRDNITNVIQAINGQTSGLQQ